MELTTKLFDRLDMGDKVERNFGNGPVFSGFEVSGVQWFWT